MEDEGRPTLDRSHVEVDRNEKVDDPSASMQTLAGSNDAKITLVSSTSSQEM